MYPFDQLRDAWDAVYASVASVVPSSPPANRWDVDPHATWLDPTLQIGMTCGWPLIMSLRDQVRVVGTFAYELDGTASHLYRSMIVARHAAPLQSFAGATAAINSVESLSGNVSLCTAFGVGRNEWPGPVVWSGAHVNSIAALRRGDADIASVDALSYAYIARDEPALVSGLHVVGRGPAVPCLPFIVNGGATDAELAQWRAGFQHAATDPALGAVRRTLRIRRFVPLDLRDYDDALAPLR